MQEINTNVLVVGDFNAFNKNNHGIDIQVDLRVEEPGGAVVTDQRSRSSGQFAFTSKVSGEYKVHPPRHLRPPKTARHSNPTVSFIMYRLASCFMIPIWCPLRW